MNEHLATYPTFHIQNRRLHEAQTAANKTEAYFAKSAAGSVHLKALGSKAHIQIISKDLDGAEKTLIQAKEIFQRNAIIPPAFCGDYFLSQLFFDIYLLELATLSNNKSSITEFRKKVSKSTKIALKNSKKFLLFLPEGELHELGLLFYSYLIKRKGHSVIYLGQSVPLADIIEVDKLKNFDYLLTAFITSFTNHNISEYLKDMSSTFNDKTIFVFVDGVKNFKSLPKNVLPVSSPSEFLEKI